MDLTAAALAANEAPVLPLPEQQLFDRLQSEVTALKSKHAALHAANATSLSARLERVLSEGG